MSSNRHSLRYWKHMPHIASFVQSHKPNIQGGFTQHWCESASQVSLNRALLLQSEIYASLLFHESVWEQQFTPAPPSQAHKHTILIKTRHNTRKLDIAFFSELNISLVFLLS